MERRIAFRDPADSPVEAPVAHKRLSLAPRPGRGDERMDAHLALGGSRARRARRLPGRRAGRRFGTDLFRRRRVFRTSVGQPIRATPGRGLRARHARDRGTDPRHGLVRGRRRSEPSALDPLECGKEGVGATAPASRFPRRLRVVAFPVADGHSARRVRRRVAACLAGVRPRCGENLSMGEGPFRLLAGPSYGP